MKKLLSLVGGDATEIVFYTSRLADPSRPDWWPSHAVSVGTFGTSLTHSGKQVLRVPFTLVDYSTFLYWTPDIKDPPYYDELLAQAEAFTVAGGVPAFGVFFNNNLRTILNGKGHAIDFGLFLAAN